ncbi:MAG TPA: beta-propeller fold lactonase family protein [Opitutaceae bacterium]|jgi:DNA-binding beta-propeller fold protein YncE
MRLVQFLAFAAWAAPAAADFPGYVLVANQGDHTVTMIDAAERRAVATIPEDAVTGHELVASPDGRYAFVPVYGNSAVGMPGIDGRSILVVSLAQRAVVHTIDLGEGTRPHCIRYDQNRRRLYVTTELDRSVTVVDPFTWKILGRIPTRQSQSHMLVITRDGRTGYTANVGPGTVSVLDLAGRAPAAVIRVATHVQRIGLSSDERWVFTSDTENPRLAMIDVAARKVSSWVDLPGKGYGVAAGPLGRGIMVAIPSKGQLAWVDLGARRVTRTLNLPGTPQEILMPPRGMTAYVSCGASASVAIVDLVNWQVEAILPAGKRADGLAWAPK